MLFVSAGVYVFKAVTTGEMDDTSKSSVLMFLAMAFILLGELSHRISRLEKTVQELRVQAAKGS